MFAERTSKNTEIIIDDMWDVEYKNFEYKYTDFKNAKQKKARINKNSEIIYNDGTVASGFDRYIPDCGTIKLIDNNNDNICEYVIIDEYKYIICSSVNEENGIIYAKFNQNEKVDTNNNDVRIYDENKKTADISAITQDEILCIKESYGRNINKLIKITLCGKQKTGVISKIVSRTDEATLVSINDTEYKLCKNFGYNSSMFSLGDNVVYYLGLNDEIIHIYKSGISESTNMGYIKRCLYNDENEEYSIRLFNTAGYFDTYYLDEKARIRCNGNEERISTFGVTELIDRLNNKLCIYKFNSKDKICSIEIAPEYEAGSDADYIGLHMTAKNQRGNWLATVPILTGSKILLEKKCIAFSIPSDKSREDKYKVGIAAANMPNNNETEINLDIYQTRNSRETLFSDVIVGTDIFNSAASVNQFHMILVSSIQEYYNEAEEEIAYRVKGLYKGKEVEYTTESKEVVDENDIKPGDLISVGLSEKSDIVAVVKRFDYATKNTYDKNQNALNPTTSLYTGEYKLVYGKAYYRLENGFEMIYGSEPNYVKPEKNSLDVMNINTNTWVYIYDSERKKAELGTIDDIRCYKTYGQSCDDIIMGWCEWAFYQMIVLYR